MLAIKLTQNIYQLARCMCVKTDNLIQVGRDTLEEPRTT